MTARLARAVTAAMTLAAAICCLHPRTAHGAYFDVYNTSYAVSHSEFTGTSDGRQPELQRVYPKVLASLLDDKVLDAAVGRPVYESLLALPLVTDGGADGGRRLRRRLLQGEDAGALESLSALWVRKGRYAIVRNPDMPGGRSSTGQIAIHSVLLPESYKILIFGRNLPTKGPKSIPEPGVYGNVSTVYDVATGTYAVAPNFETLFCAGHTLASDGLVVAAGGDSGEKPYPWMREGRDVVRTFDRSTMAWTTLTGKGTKLSEYRWYPTQTALPDDRVVIVSGFDNDPARKGKPATGIDIYDHKRRRIVASKSKYQLGKKFFTNVTPGYQLYPSVYLLPWIDPKAPEDYFFYFFTCRTGQVARMTGRTYDFTPMHNHGLPVKDICAQFSAMGSSLILPLRPERGYAFEVAMFGGGTQGKGLDCAGICNAPAAPYVFRYQLPNASEALAGRFNKYFRFNGKDQWETMPYGRVFADAVMLPNGKIVVVNGAQQGVPGGNIWGGGTAKNAAYTAVLYDPEARGGNRITELATSTIKRYYHSNALLLPSGDVWIAGNEQTDCIQSCRTDTAPPGHEYRAEVLQLPYAFQPRPRILRVSTKRVLYGATLTVTYSHTRDASDATIIPPGANTHGLNMMQRLIFLRRGEGRTPRAGPVTATPTTRTMVVRMPQWSDRIANPGYWMLWVLDGDVPCQEAAWIQLARTANPKPAAGGGRRRRRRGAA